MGSVVKLAEAFRMGLKQAHPKLRKSLLKKVPLAVASMPRCARNDGVNSYD